LKSFFEKFKQKLHIFIGKNKLKKKISIFFGGGLVTGFALKQKLPISA